MDELQAFICPRARYYGQVKPQNLVFNAKLQEFAHRVSFIANLETAGKLASQTAYEQTKDLWEQLESSKEQLEIGQQLVELEEF
jgi:hypothetical protein